MRSQNDSKIDEYCVILSHIFCRLSDVINSIKNEKSNSIFVKALFEFKDLISSETYDISRKNITQYIIDNFSVSGSFFSVFKGFFNTIFSLWNPNQDILNFPIFYFYDDDFQLQFCLNIIQYGFSSFNLILGSALAKLDRKLNGFSIIFMKFKSNNNIPNEFDYEGLTFKSFFVFSESTNKSRECNCFFLDSLGWCQVLNDKIIDHSMKTFESILLMAEGSVFCGYIKNINTVEVIRSKSSSAMVPNSIMQLLPEEKSVFNDRRVAILKFFCSESMSFTIIESFGFWSKKEFFMIVQRVIKGYNHYAFRNLFANKFITELHDEPGDGIEIVVFNNCSLNFINYFITLEVFSIIFCDIDNEIDLISLDFVSSHTVEYATKVLKKSLDHDINYRLYTKEKDRFIEMSYSDSLVKFSNKCLFYYNSRNNLSKCIGVVFVDINPTIQIIDELIPISSNFSIYSLKELSLIKLRFRNILVFRIPKDASKLITLNYITENDDHIVVQEQLPMTTRSIALDFIIVSSYLPIIPTNVAFRYTFNSNDSFTEISKKINNLLCYRVQIMFYFNGLLKTPQNTALVKELKGGTFLVSQIV